MVLCKNEGGVFLCALVIVAGIIYFLNREINKSVYSERQEMLSLATTSGATVVNEHFKKEWSVFDVMNESMLNRLRDNIGGLETIISDMNRKHSFGDDYYYFVNDKGHYYASDGTHGKLADFTPFDNDTPERYEFISTLPHMDQSALYMTCRERYKSPIKVMTKEGEVEIAFFAYAQSVKPTTEVINKLFPGKTNVFIHDKTGLMLYKEFGIKLLIEGYNVYPKFAECKRPFGEKPEELVEKSKNREPIVLAMKIDGNEFYFTSAPLEVEDWTLAFVIPEEVISSMSGNGFKKVIGFVAIIAILIGLLLLTLVYRTFKQKEETEKKKKAEELANAMSEASRAKSRFLSNMSHDIRTPINGIMGLTAIAKGVEGNPQKTSECLDKISGASGHLLSLINDVLDMSRIESGRTTITPVPSDIRAICENCSSIIRGQLADRDIKFTTAIEAEHPKVMADELHIRQVFINILGNAVKFTNDGGKIWFTAKEIGCDDDRVTYRFEFKDTGIGMSKEFISKIYDAFSQEGNRARTNYNGTGLGMAISKQLVELMNGTIDIKSVVDKGSLFTVTLTFNICNTDALAEDEKVPDTSIEGVKILLVEDNDLNMEIAMEMLSEKGAVIADTAMDGVEAVKKFSEHEPGTYDVILMDVMMPNMNGLEATKAIRNLDRADAETIPIIAMTANAFFEDIQSTKAAGMNAHLSKPIDFKEVVKTVAKFVNKPTTL